MRLPVKTAMPIKSAKQLRPSPNRLTRIAAQIWGFDVRARNGIATIVDNLARIQAQ
jgi:hypothetical protein